MNIQIDKVPFSRFGSYFAVTKTKEGTILLRDVHGGDEAPSTLFEMRFFKEQKEVKVKIEASERELKFYQEEKTEDAVKLILPTEHHVLLKAEGLTVGLFAKKVKYDTFHALSEDTYEYHIYPKERKLLFTRREGILQVDAPWEIIGNPHVTLLLSDGELLVESYVTVPGEGFSGTYEEGLSAVQEDFRVFKREPIGLQEKYRPSFKLASYITWSSVVAPFGALKHPAMFMSKLYMYSIWSWDNCFNALALAKERPELSYGQFEIFFDHQDSSGAYPDFVHDKYASFNCIKPPIFPVFYEKCMKENAYFAHRSRLEKAYESMKRNLAYYDTYRTFPGALPHYRHGNDSGWDNSSVFHVGMPVESPDLQAHLVRAYDAMARLAHALKKDEEEREYQEKAKIHAKKTLERLYDEEEGFFARVGIQGEPVKNRDSLLLSMSLLLSRYLPEPVLKKTVERLLSFETPYGFATEHPKSPLYKYNGYWQGPIWAPVTFLLVDALYEAGYEHDADRIRNKFMDLTLVGGMAENFDPFTGEGLVDTSFTWTSSVCLLFLRGEGLCR
ncbi:amylo-alpha-1,6-glucosidase [Proteiniclasticum ruminis]|uniref:Trehalase n=1 Tax=Proteiniclasticum ruminis TaxID=398199 RepID=A0A1I5BWN9_9CLOT|nr:trehalase family glycosidase [Proteiniclasticum ruminis]SFN79138.1 Trehalase [Proteiniclasticum ruminis]